MPFECGVLLPIECKPEQRLPLCRTMPNAWWWSCYQKRWRFVLCTWYLVAPLQWEAWSSRWLLLVVGTKCTLRRCCRRNTCVGKKDRAQKVWTTTNRVQKRPAGEGVGGVVKQTSVNKQCQMPWKPEHNVNQCANGTRENKTRRSTNTYSIVLYTFLWQNELGSEYTAMVLLLLLRSAVRYELMNCCRRDLLLLLLLWCPG